MSNARPSHRPKGVMAKCSGPPYGGPGSPSSWITENTSSAAPSPIRPSRACTTRKWPLIPTRNSTVARNTVSRMYLSAVSPASVPLANASSAACVGGLGRGRLGNDVLGHVRGPRRSVGIVRGVGRKPRVERRLVAGPQPLHRQRLGLLVADRERAEPGVERHGIKRARDDRIVVEADWRELAAPRPWRAESRTRSPISPRHTPSTPRARRRATAAAPRRSTVGGRARTAPRSRNRPPPQQPVPCARRSPC